MVHYWFMEKFIIHNFTNILHIRILNFLAWLNTLFIFFPDSLLFYLVLSSFLLRRGFYFFLSFLEWTVRFVVVFSQHTIATNLQVLTWTCRGASVLYNSFKWVLCKLVTQSHYNLASSHPGGWQFFFEN